MTAQPDQPGNTEPVVTPLRAPAGTMRTRKRHVAAILAFFAIVLAPVAGTAWYLYGVAADQYASTVGFSVRKEDFSSPIELFGGVTDFGSSGTSDSDILYEFIQSQQMVETLENRIGLSDIFARPENDPVFAFDESGSVEDLHRRWRWMTRVTYDAGTELIEVRALAFAPDDATAITTALLARSSQMINALSTAARDDAIGYAREELDEAVERLKNAREAVTRFRIANEIVDPTTDTETQAGVLASLQEQLTEALIEQDLLDDSTGETDPRMVAATRRIAVIRERIAEERDQVGQETGGAILAEVVGEYERLTVDREFAEQAYIASLAAFDSARAEARRKSRYLATHITPTTAETPRFPQRGLVLAMVAGFAFLTWAIIALAGYSLRDRR